ncbi:hypothetical protein CEP52_001019 [Fusarium oligoseptatum]|uniref:Uncharacterized protein n=2 Tax=Fusarium solani species complex TaxID=232080 RepID=A0A428UKV9_9HYPO|nr:hypothetical protein CEP51_010747 [Fusarium floridanum]RSM14914.1 hypothetical protein CEP52_001019 [Fusarium oligoseptatum]
MQAQNSHPPCNEGVPSPYPSQSNHNVTYPCITQRHVPASASAAQLGSNGHLSRYPANATLCYLVCLDALQTETAGQYAVADVGVTRQAWSLGPVRLQCVLVFEDAFFSLGRYGGAPNDMALATAFPNCTSESPVVKVYPPLFGYREAATNTLYHEQSLHHEFPAQTEWDNPVVHWGIPNPESAMNHYNYPLDMAVHEPDMVLTNAPYTYHANNVQGLPIDVVSPPR